MLCENLLPAIRHGYDTLAKAMEKTSSAWVLPNSSVLNVCAKQKEWERNGNSNKKVTHIGFRCRLLWLSHKNYPGQIVMMTYPCTLHKSTRFQNKNIIVIIQQVRKKTLFVQLWTINQRVHWLIEKRISRRANLLIKQAERLASIAWQWMASMHSVGCGTRRFFHQI